MSRLQAKSILPAVKEVTALMLAERSLVAPEEKYVFKVSQWKWAPDKSAPWWQHLFFHWVYLPFQNFSLSVFKIPSVMEVIVESDEKGRVRRTFRWFEDEAIYEDEDRADLACLAEPWGYRKMPVNQLHPSQSTQSFGTIFPRKKNPRKWATPTFPLFAKSRREEQRQQQEAAKREQQLAESLRQLNQVLDR